MSGQLATIYMGLGKMEEDPKKLGNEPAGGGGEDLLAELKFFLENRLDGLLEEAEKFRTVKHSVQGNRSRFRKKNLPMDKNQGFLPFLYPVPPIGEGNSEEPGSKVSGDEN